MSIFDTVQQKWVKSHINSGWNKLFTNLGQYDVMVTKLMVYKCVTFADSLLSSDLFTTENLALRTETILLAKMQFYHLVTKSATIHNLFYGYIHELWTNHYHEDVETAHLALDRMRSLEKWYLTWYYDYYNSENGSLVPVIKEYCKNTQRNSGTDGCSVLRCTTEELHRHAAKLLMDMHISFMDELK